VEERSKLGITLRLDGPLVEEHRLPLSELERVAGLLRGALRGVAIVLTNAPPTVRGGRTRGHIESATDLVVVGTPREGSFVMDLEPPAPAPTSSDQEPLVRDDEGLLANRTVEVLVEGIDALDEEMDALPRGFDRGVLRTVEAFRPSIRKGITSINIEVAIAGGQTRTARIDSETVKIVKKLIKRPVRAHTVAEGTLEMVDRARLEGRIDRPPHPSIACTFREEDRAAALDAAFKFVRVSGDGQFPPDSDSPTRLDVDALTVMFEAAPFDDGVFWETSSIEAMAAEQEVSPFRLEADEWRDDDEAEALIAAIGDGG
jgi:hypothetical protein